MTAWSAWYDYTIPELPGVSAALVDAYLRKAAIEFCNETGAYTLTLAAVDIVANTATYSPVSPDTEAEVFMAKQVWASTLPLDFAPTDVLETKSSNWELDTAQNASAYTQKRYDQIQLYPIPTSGVTGGLVVKAVLRPTLTAVSLADHIATQYFDAIAAGAKSLLAGMPAKPWSMPDVEAKYRAQFEAGKTRAIIDVNRSLMRSALKIALKPAA